MCCYLCLHLCYHLKQTKTNTMIAVTKIRPAIIPFNQHVEIWGQTLTVTGKATIERGDDGQEIGDIEFTSVGINCYSDALKQVVFTAVIDVKSLEYKQLLELENALIGQHAHEIYETQAADVA